MCVLAVNSALRPMRQILRFDWRSGDLRGFERRRETIDYDVVQQHIRFAVENGKMFSTIVWRCSNNSVYILCYRTTSQSCSEKRYRVCRLSAVLCPRTIRCRKITTTNGTVRNRTSRVRQTGRITLNRSTPTGKFFEIFNVPVKQQ